jgi:hypothetical protein
MVSGCCRMSQLRAAFGKPIWGKPPGTVPSTDTPYAERFTA